MKRPCAAACAAMLLAGCVSPKLTRHYESMEKLAVAGDPTSKEPNLTLSMFLAQPKKAEQDPLITRLSARAQAELIRSVAATLPAGSKSDALLSALVSPAAPAPAACGWADATSLSRRVTITVLGDLVHPADRIDKLQFDLVLGDASDPAPQRATFVSWDRFDTVYGSYDLGSAKYTQSRKLDLGKTGTDTAKLAADAGSAVKVLDVGYEASNSLEENMKYSIRRLSVGGALNDNTATLVQEGGPYINLLGSSSATFSIKLAKKEGPLPVQSFSMKDGNKTAPDDVVVVNCNASFPASKAKLVANISGKAVLRTVSLNHATLSEGDDAVVVKTHVFNGPPLTLADTSELEVNYYGLVSCTSRAGKEECQRLFIENLSEGKVTDEVLVPSVEAATTLRAWLLANVKPGKPLHAIGGQRVGMSLSKNDGGGEGNFSLLTAETAKSLRIMLLGGNLAPRPPRQTN
ncbi:hypothetical protein ACQ4WP_15720 [Janthinobacterium sp. GB4P2]|uniref:hypothetical protein n=1 Tax=Janthinobacterium sp. GB4P2 TaxID=3424189 RepID=UPI003F1F3521